MSEKQMALLGETHGVKWYWAQPGEFEAPGVYYWDGEQNVLVQPAASAEPWKEIALDAIRRMRAGHVGCMDIIGQAESLLQAERAAPVAAQPSVPDGWKLVPDYKAGAHVKFGGEEYKIFALGDRPGSFDICHPTDNHRDRWMSVPPDLLEPLSPTPAADAPCEHSDHVRPADGVCVECGEVAQQDDIAKSIHYPDCWDTAAYPTLSSALHELHAWFRCSNDDCPTIPLPQQETCQTCQGNGEIVTDWERYREPHDGDKGDEAVAECPDCDGQGTVEQDAEKVDAPSPEWMTCESRRPWVTNSLEHHIKELRGAEKRSRNAFKKDYMGEPARYFADACGEAAALFESRLSAIAAAIQERQP